jgi:predicted glycosyltransferase
MLHKLVMKNFHQVWIPDYQKAPTLSGSLSHSDISPDSRVYVGPLSRFCNNPRIPKDVVAKEFIIDVKLPDNIDILVIISGPEPQRTIFEKILFEQLKTRKENVLILRGTPEENAGFKLSESVFVTNHLPTEQLEPIFKKAGVIIARSGYSTIMDLAATGKKAILVPTPGQTEQEYLAHRLMANGIFYSDSQNRINLDKALKEAYVFKGINTIEADSESLEEVIANVVKMELS